MYRNWSSLNITVRLRLRGLPRIGSNPLSTLIGNVHTPFIWAGPMAIVAAATPWPATISTTRPPIE